MASGSTNEPSGEEIQNAAKKYTVLNEGIDIVTKAIEEDKKKNYGDALMLYTEGIQKLNVAKMYEAKSDKSKESIQNKVDVYQNRADFIQEFLMSKGAKEKHTVLNEGIDVVTKAMEEDKKKNYAEALMLYTEGIQKLNVAKMCEAKSDKSKESIQNKVDAYQKRADLLQEFLMREEAKEKVKPTTEGNQDNVDSNETNDDSNEILESLFWEREKVHWNDVAGLTEEKEKLKEYVIFPAKFTPQSSDGGTPDFGACLLYGAPGTGKTFLARAVGTELCNSKFLHVAGSDIVSKWLGVSEKLTTDLFRYAKRNIPCVLFIDDIDMLCNVGYESDMARAIKAELLFQLEEMRTAGVQVMAATSIPWKIDSAVRERFFKYIYLALPDQQTRAELIKIMSFESPNSLTEEDMDVVASKTEGYTGADLSCLVRDALMEPIRKLQKATHFCETTGPSVKDPEIIVYDLLTPCSPDTYGAVEMNVFQIPEDKLLVQKLTLEDLMTALNKSKPSINEEEIQKYLDFQKLVDHRLDS